MHDIFDNILLLTDSYKASHYKQYPPGTEYVYSYFESRGGKYEDTCFFGLQYLILRYLSGQVVTQEKIDFAATVFAEHFGNAELFNKAGWQYILDKHNGHLPVEIKAVPEGVVVPTGNVLMTIVNTDPECYWLTNYLETLLVQVWYPSTVATISRTCKGAIKDFLDHTSDDSGGLPFKLHDFGFRGVSSVESAAIGGAAHLVNFQGTDTVVALPLIHKYYNGSFAEGQSIPASEHSTITSWGKSGELDAYRNMLEQYPTGLVACVSDSYNIYTACNQLWGEELRDQILSREGTLVIRPDSGRPLDVVMDCLEILWRKFEGYTNGKGFRVLNDKVRLIQGDGVTPDDIILILSAMANEGWSADNIAFGMGGGLLQKLNRDTQKYAFKCSQVIVNGKERDVWKAPVTDISKRSKRGRLSLRMNKTGQVVTVPECDPFWDALGIVFRNGKPAVLHSFADIRRRAKI